MYADSLLSHSGHILGSNSIVTWNFRHTITYIDVHHVELLSHHTSTTLTELPGVGKSAEVWGR